MSHYTVAVITKKGWSIDDALEPFDENKEVAPYVAYTKKELIAEERKNIIESALRGNYADYLKDPKAYEERHKDQPSHLKYIKEEFPKLLMASDDEIYERRIQYYDESEVDSDGSVISTYNPKSQWDWYMIGGRWSGMLLTKSGEHVDSCSVKDLDLEGMCTLDPKEKARLSRFWDIIVEGEKPTKEEKDSHEFFSMYNKQYYLDRYKTKQNFLQKSAQFSTYAILNTKGEWLEAGKMGWWGISSADAEDEQAWDDNYIKILKDSMGPDDVITIVDCHI